ncbi:GntR family transcriptional regulator, partial [Kitasatospora nipponensis]
MIERSPRGTYLQIADALRAEIGGDPQVTNLPSEAELMAAHGVARSTVKRALDVLATEGLIKSQPGVGWSVVGGDTEPPLLDRITGYIEIDQLKIGDPFPSEKVLTERTGASRHTVRRVLAQ